MTEETAGTPMVDADAFNILWEKRDLVPSPNGAWVGAALARRLEREVAALTEQRDRIVEVIHGIENRCMAADGPVTQTSDEITERELCMIYALAKGENENWRPNNGK